MLDAFSRTEVLMILAEEKVNLILLDLMLSGLNVEEQTKKEKVLAIILLLYFINNN